LTNKRSIPKTLGIIVLGIWIGVGVGIVVLAVGSSMGWISFDLTSALDIEQPSSMETGIPAPDFELLSTDGDVVSLSGLKGKFVVVNFWATWCGPCIQEMPMLEEYYNKYSPDLVVLGINEKENPNVVREFLEQIPISYPILLDRSAELAPIYQLMALPVTVFVDQEGILRFHHIGFMTEEQFDNYLFLLGVSQ
jgi:thiol-disulfide isomerase/thioredoxin